MKEHETKPSFEERLKRLDEIARTIEQQTLPLEESIKLYEEGAMIIKELEGELSLAKEKVEKIITK